MELVDLSLEQGVIIDLVGVFLADVGDGMNLESAVSELNKADRGIFL